MMQDRHDGSDTPRRRKLLFHATHRGMREMDMMIGGYVGEKIYSMTEREVTLLERLLAFSDAELFRHFFEGESFPDDSLNQLTYEMKKFCLEANNNTCSPPFV